MQTAPSKIANPDQSRLILHLIRDGWTPAEIMRSLGISRATYYRRLAEVRSLRGEAAAGRDEDA